MYYIPLESSFLVDFKNDTVFTLWSIFGHFINTFLQEMSQKLKSIPFLDSTEKELSIGTIYFASTIKYKQTLRET